MKEEIKKMLERNEGINTTYQKLMGHNQVSVVKI